MPLTCLMRFQALGARESKDYCRIAGRSVTKSGSMSRPEKNSQILGGRRLPLTSPFIGRQPYYPPAWAWSGGHAICQTENSRESELPPPVALFDSAR